MMNHDFNQLVTLARMQTLQQSTTEDLLGFISCMGLLDGQNKERVRKVARVLIGLDPMVPEYEEELEDVRKVAES
jgi:hypothetical protein